MIGQIFKDRYNIFDLIAFCAATSFWYGGRQELAVLTLIIGFLISIFGKAIIDIKKSDPK